MQSHAHSFTLSTLCVASNSGAQTLRVENTGDRSALVVSATGEAAAVPDRAVLGINIEAQARSAAEAAANMSRIHDRVLDTLRALGIRSAGMRTTNHGVASSPAAGPRPAYDSAGVRPTIYVSRAAVRVDVTRIEQLNEITTAALARGAAGVSTPMFSSRGADSARRAAAISATQQARSEAAAIAAALGGTLGKLIELSSNAAMDPRFRQQPPMYYDFSPPAAPPSTQTLGRVQVVIVPGEILFVAQVTARWEFLPGGQ